MDGWKGHGEGKVAYFFKVPAENRAIIRKSIRWATSISVNGRACRPWERTKSVISTASLIAVNENAIPKRRILVLPSLRNAARKVKKPQ